MCIGAAVPPESCALLPLAPLVRMWSASAATPITHAPCRRAGLRPEVLWLGQLPLARAPRQARPSSLSSPPHTQMPYQQLH
jgi:hypothetical protein